MKQNQLFKDRAKRSAAVFLFMFSSVWVFAQTVNGTVNSNDGPLPGASIVEKGTTNGTQADFDGNFIIDINNDEAILVISYIGFSTKEIPVNKQQNISVILEEDAQGLDEVVVIGYGTSKKRDITGAVTRVDLEDSPVALT